MSNPMMQRLRAGKACVNGWMLTPDSFVAEVMAKIGWDSVTIDVQHGLQDYMSAARCLQAMHGRGATPLVRVPWNEPGIIGKLLDAGAWGIICPMVNSASEASALVDACLYPPVGMRSNGPVRAGLYSAPGVYQSIANENVLVLPQIETLDAVANLDAILDVPGISGVYIGPGDLALSMGLPPHLDREEPEILAIYENIIAATRRRNQIAGIQNMTPAYAGRMGKMGFQILTVATDINLMIQAAVPAIKATREFAGEAAVTELHGSYQ
jgi:4-hydroxy-2-oxoheptanedioate aldolase